MNFNFIEHYRDLAVNTYHVDPVIFIIIYLVSIPIFYYGLYRVGKAVIEYKSKEKKKHILAEKDMLLGLIITLSAWISPYIYVIFLGENLPMWFWGVFFVFLLITGYFLWKELHNRIKT